MTRDDLFGYLAHDNVSAFLRVIREGESSQNDSAYTVMFGGDHFDPDSYEDHPRIKNSVKLGNKVLYSTAAGAYQFLASTWDEMAKKYGLNDFGPTNQDIAAVALIHRRKALDDVLAGRLDEALAKCAREWASLPGSPYGQPTLTRAKAHQVYLAHGGRIGAAGPSPKPQGAPMPAPIAMAAISAFLPEIVKLLPKLGSIFGSGSEQQQKNIAAATMVGEALVSATNAPNLQAAVERMGEDPEALRAAAAAVDDIWPMLGEAGGGGIKAAREAAYLPDGDWRKLVFSFPFFIALAILPLIWAVVLASLFRFEWLAVFTDDQRIMILAAVINLGLGSLIGFAFGTSIGSQRKDQLLGSRQ